MASKDYIAGRDPVPKLGPFASSSLRRLGPGPSTGQSFSSSTRQQRQNVPYYAKPVRVQVQNMEPRQPSGLFASLKQGATQLLNRFIGRPHSAAAAVEQTSVVARDHVLDVSHQELEFDEFAQLQRIPPFSINKVDQINFFSNEKQISSGSSASGRPQLRFNLAKGQGKRGFSEHRVLAGEDPSSPANKKRLKISDDVAV